MYKWLTIMGIVCLGFIVVLLSLGYLLKENEVATTALKLKLDQQNLLNNTDENTSTAILTFVDSNDVDSNRIEGNKASIAFLNKQKTIIAKNLTCVSTHQCTVVNTKRTELGCKVPINIIGASLLKKVIKQQSTSSSYVAGVCKNQGSVTSECKQNLCQLTP
jgi:hypothetical protein